MLGISETCKVCVFICLMSGTAVVVAVAKKIASVKWMEYIGKNSIVFYFFYGVFPAVVGSISCSFFLMEVICLPYPQCSSLLFLLLLQYIA